MTAEFLRSYFPLTKMVAEFDILNEETVPNQDERVARKEALIASMSDFIKTTIPLHFASSANLPGLRAGFSRALGEAGHPSHRTFAALRAFTHATGRTDWNLKHQIVRAYRALHLRFQTNTDIPIQADLALPYLMDHADTDLLNVIELMKIELGLPDIAT